MEMLKEEAPEGQIWVCPACARTSKDRMKMGDTSCVIWAVLCYEEKENGKYVAVSEKKKVDRAARTILLEPGLINRILEWHGGMGSASYRLASTAMSGHVSIEDIETAWKEFYNSVPHGPEEKKLGTSIIELTDLMQELKDAIHLAEQGGPSGKVRKKNARGEDHRR